jgi:hypothetical protein
MVGELLPSHGKPNVGFLRCHIVILLCTKITLRKVALEYF